MLWNTAPIYAPHFPYYASKKFSLQYSIDATSYRALRCLPPVLKFRKLPYIHADLVSLILDCCYLV